MTSEPNSGCCRSEANVPSSCSTAIVRREHRPLIRFPIRTDGRTLFVQPDGETARNCVLHHSFQCKETISADNGRLHLLVALLTLDATMGLESLLTNWFIMPPHFCLRAPEVTMRPISTP